jgi:hypothetical protein
MESTASSCEQWLQLKYISEEVQRLNKAMASMLAMQEEGRQDSVPHWRPTGPLKQVILPVRDPPSSRTKKNILHQTPPFVC